jgi:hypothetical protein
MEGPESILEKLDIDNSPNPSYTTWYKKDQALLGILFPSIIPNLVASVYGLNTSKQVWTALKTRFSCQSRSRIVHMKCLL